MRNRKLEFKLIVDTDYEEYTRREIDYFDCGDKKLEMDYPQFKITSELKQNHYLDPYYYINLYINNWTTFNKLNTDVISDYFVSIIRTNKDLILTSEDIDTIHKEVRNMFIYLRKLHGYELMEQDGRLDLCILNDAYSTPITLKEHTHKRKTPLPKEYSIRL